MRDVDYHSVGVSYSVFHKYQYASWIQGSTSFFTAEVASPTPSNVNVGIGGAVTSRGGIEGASTSLWALGARARTPVGVCIREKRWAGPLKVQMKDRIHSRISE